MNLCCKIQVCYLNVNVNIPIPFTDSCLHCGGIRSIFHVDKWLAFGRSCNKISGPGAQPVLNLLPYCILYSRKNYTALLFPKHIQLCASILLLVLFILPERHLAHLWLLTSHPSTLPSSASSEEIPRLPPVVSKLPCFWAPAGSWWSLLCARLVHVFT